MKIWTDLKGVLGNVDFCMIRDENFKERIRKHFPFFDFSQPLTRSELVILRKALRRKEREEKINLRKKHINSEEMKPGVLVINSDTEEIREILTISKAGRLHFKGKKGSFDPRYWKRYQN